jgi:Pretoxin HINT domain
VPDEATTPSRWVDAADLRVGDELVLRDGRIEPIEQLRLYTFFDTVYHFEVDDLHCYAVGRSGILVHNNNGSEA